MDVPVSHKWLREDNREAYKDGYKNGYCTGYDKGFEKGHEAGRSFFLSSNKSEPSYQYLKGFTDAIKTYGIVSVGETGDVA